VEHAHRSRDADVLVIGAGQAGLSAAHHLGRTRTDHLVLDANPAPGGAWQHRWPSLTMATVNGIRELPGMPRPETLDSERDRRASDVISEYFAEYEQHFQLAIERPVQVSAVQRAPGGFTVTSDGGTYTARGLINATGTWTKPFWPWVPGRDRFAGRQLHTHDYPGPKPFAGSRVMVVGGGISALQALMELGPITERVHWVTRREPVFVEREFTPELGRAAVAMVIERVEAGLPPRSVVSVTGLGLNDAVRRAQAAGYLDRRPMFAELTESGARWAEGEEIEVDTILWATGFRAALDHLAPLHLRGPSGGIVMDGTRVVAEPRVHLVGYGPSASTVGANRAGRAAVAELRRLLQL